MASESLFFTLLAFAFALGGVVGSFLNVVIYRVPAGKSVVTPGSHCPECDSAIRWYDNIPIISWFILDGSCRDCDAEISPRYAVVEALMGFLSAALWIKVAATHFGPDVPITDVPWLSVGLAFSFYFVFLALLVVITFVDLDHYLIPHEFTLPGIAIGIAAAFVLNSAWMEPGSLAGLWPEVTVAKSVIGLLAGGLSVILLFYLYYAARGVEGLGGGDVTMMALMGTWLGWPALIFIFFAASVQGLIAAAIGSLVGADFLSDSRDILAEDEALDDSEPTARRRVGEDSDDEEPDNSDDEDSDDDGDDEDSDDDGDETPEDTADDQPPEGGLAIPFGPFIALAALEFFFVGEFLPQWISLSYLYHGF